MLPFIENARAFLVGIKFWKFITMTSNNNNKASVSWSNGRGKLCIVTTHMRTHRHMCHQQDYQYLSIRSLLRTQSYLSFNLIDWCKMIIIIKVRPLWWSYRNHYPVYFSIGISTETDNIKHCKQLCKYRRWGLSNSQLKIYLTYWTLSGRCQHCL